MTGYVNNNDVVKELEEIVKEFEPIGLLSYVSMYIHTISTSIAHDNSKKFDPLKAYPVLPFLAGLCLKIKKQSNTQVKFLEIDKILELLSIYFENIMTEDFKDSKEKLDFDIRLLKIFSTVQYLTSQMHPYAYNFQITDLLNNLTGKFNDYFLEKKGFTVQEAIHFGEMITNWHIQKFNASLHEINQRVEKTKNMLKDPEQIRQLQDAYGQNVDLNDLLEQYTLNQYFSYAKSVYVFDINEIIKNNEMLDKKKLSQYLFTLSCKIGDGDPKFDSPFDNNVIFKKPLIDIGKDQYLCPIPHYLFHNLFGIFEEFLEDEKKNDIKIWNRYVTEKTNYVEDRSEEYLSRLFPKDSIHRNLHYDLEGNPDTDLLIPFDDKLFIIEAKSGDLTDSAKRGSVIRLEKDLKKLTEEAYQQGKRVRNYVNSVENAIFRDEKGNIKLEIKRESGNIKCFLINVTLEPLMSLGTQLKKLRALGLFKDDEYPWTIDLFELDIITRHVLSPTIFIHYLERRLDAQIEDNFLGADELAYFSWYLQIGNFYSFPIKDDKTDAIGLSGELVEPFNDHYSYGKDPPKLKIEPELLEMIKSLELLRDKGYSNVTSILLDLDHTTRELLLNKIQNTINKTLKDGKRHDTLIVYPILKIGITFLSFPKHDDLKENLVEYCMIQKYEAKVDRWLGIGRDTSDPSWHISEFVFLQYPWKEDPEMERKMEYFLEESRLSNKIKNYDNKI